MEADLSYFSRRAAEERAAATCAEHPNARQAHLDLADRYEDLASALAASRSAPAAASEATRSAATARPAKPKQLRAL